MPSSITHEQLTQEEFENILDGMKTHYVATIKGESSEPLPRSLSSYRIASFEKNDSLNEFEEKVIKETGSGLSAWKDKAEPQITELTKKKVNNEISDKDWNDQIEKRKKADQDEADKQIDDTYDKVRDRGNAHPEERGKLLQLADFVSQGIQDIVNIVVDFIEDLAQKISEWLKAAYEYIKQTFVTVDNAISDIFG